MPDHVHEVELPGGGAPVTTGPAITTDGEIPPPPPELQELRATPALKRKAVAATEVADIERQEGPVAANALQAGDPALLPDFAKVIWRRMFESAKRYSSDERYSAAMAWRAIRQKYNIAAPKRAAAQAKSAMVGTLAGQRDGAWIVRISSERDVDQLYEKTEQVPLTFAPGASVTVGIGASNHRNLINVMVPKSLVSSTPNEAGAIKWVRHNWRDIWRFGKGYMAFQNVKRCSHRVLPFRRFMQQKTGNAPAYVADPSEATEQIVFGEVYAPWEVDLQGEYATEGEVQRMAHRFLLRDGKGGEMHSRWTMPDGQPPGVPVESFIARRGDPDFISGAWVMGMKCHPDVWEKVLTGEYVGFSIGGSWGTRPIEARRAA